MRKSIAMLLAAVVATVSMGLVSMPAHAGNFNGSCESGEVCLWDGVNYTGARADFYDNVSNYTAWHFWNSSVWLNDAVDSAQNKASWSDVLLYQHANYGGDAYWLMKGKSNGSFGSYWGNMFSSHKFVFCGLC